MQRRYKALFAITIPIVVVALVNFIYPLSYNILSGYMVGIVLLFKSSLVSLWLVSKLKIIAFIKSLTIVQAILLSIKRWFIDNMLSKWLDKYIYIHLKKPFIELFHYYKNVSFKVKIKNFLSIFLPLSIAIWILSLTNMLSNIAIFMELKVLVIAFFKALWVIIAKLFGVVPMVISWFSNSWLAPIVEVFALSYILSIIERILGVNNPITRFFNYAGVKLEEFISYLGVLNNRHIEPIIYKRLSSKIKDWGENISNSLKVKKMREERAYFENFQNLILKGHINAYYSFKGMDKIRDKKKLYSLINEKSKDNIDIIAYVSRNEKGEILEEAVDNSYYHDIFLLKGIASNQDYGVKEILNDEHIDYTDFWVMNTNYLPIWIKSYSNNIPDIQIKGNSLKFIKTKNHVNFNDKDLYFEYNGVKVFPIELI